MKFDANFVWGTATAAFQIEGSNRADGRSESIWDRFCSRPGAIADGSDGSRACDHYKLWAQDVELLKWLGVRAYRFSIAWPRVLPEGRGRVNPRGLDFYDDLVDTLLRAGITPYATLYHWDMPQVLEDAGGWPERETVNAFVEYAKAVTDRLGDRVKSWITHNEPWCAAMLGYRDGVQAPGRKDAGQALAAAHHLLLSHGLVVRMLRSSFPDAKVGIALNLVPAEAASTSAADLDACRESDGGSNRWYLDPLYGRGYPLDVIADRVRDGSLARAELPFVQPGDLEAIAEPTDFLGINYYVRHIARSNRLLEHENQPPTVFASGERTAMGWEVSPEGFERILQQVSDRYAPSAIYVTENGAAFDDPPPTNDGRVPDGARRNYLERHLAAAHRAIESGVPLHGYFQWSFMDNFEWAEGYGKRFGLFWVDYETQRRVPKDSAHWYKKLIASGDLREGST